MFGIVNYWVFILSGIVINLAPGADTMYILGNSMSNGKKAGIMSALGISTGGIIHTLLAALGLSVILAKSALIFDFVKYIGAGYLIYLGIRTMISKSPNGTQHSNIDNRSLKKIYFQGIITNTLNPKVALFFLAFLPQFVNPNNAYGPVPFILLGITFITTGTIWCIMLAVFSSYIAGIVNKKFDVTSLMSKLSGVIFIGLGFNLLMAKIAR